MRERVCRVEGEAHLWSQLAKRRCGFDAAEARHLYFEERDRRTELQSELNRLRAVPGLEHDDLAAGSTDPRGEPRPRRTIVLCDQKPCRRVALVSVLRKQGGNFVRQQSASRHLAGQRAGQGNWRQWVRGPILARLGGCPGPGERRFQVLVKARNRRRPLSMRSASAAASPKASSSACRGLSANALPPTRPIRPA